MTKSLCVLVLGEKPDETELMIEELRRSGFDPNWEQVQTREAYLGHLRPDLDVVLAGYPVSQLSAADALRLLRERNLDVPFIVVTDPSEDRPASPSLGKQADSCVPRDQLSRLGPTIEDAIKARRLRAESREADREARISARQWRAAFDAISDPIFLLDAGGRVVRCNQAAVTFVGQPRPDIVGQQCCTLVHGASGGIGGCPYSRALESLERESVVWQRDGRWLRATVDPVLDESGYLIAFVHILKDITERKKAEEETKRRTEHLRAVNELAVDLAAVQSTEDGFELIADRLRAITGAVAVSVSVYDAGEKELVVERIAADGWLLSQAAELLGRRIVGWRVPVSKESYARMVSETVSTAPDLSETTFGTVAKPVARTVQKALGIDRFVGLALADGEDLLGTAVLVFPPGQRGPSDEVLKTFARVAAASLRQRQAEEALRASEARLHSIFEDAAIGMALVNDRGRPIITNPALQEMLGYSAEEFRGMRFTDFTHPEDGDLDWRYFQELMHGERDAYQLEKRFRCKEGRLIWGRLTVSLVRDAQGQPEFAVGMVEDITERKRVEDALRESERRLSQIIEGTSLPGFVLDADHVVTHWNKACEALTGTPAPEVIGTRDHWRPFYDHERPMLADLVLEGASKAELDRYYGDRYRKSRLIEEAYDAEGFFPGLGDKGRWLFLSTAPLKNLEGKVVGVVEVFRDVSDRKRIEASLEQRVTELMLLNEIGNKITRSLGVETVLKSAVQIVQRSFGYHNVAILTLDRERDGLVLQTVAGQIADVVEVGVRVGLDEGLIGWAARQGQTVLVNDVEADPRYVSWYGGRTATRSEMSVPIRAAADVVGVLDVQSQRRDAFGVNDVLVMETLADQIAVALENARLYEAERVAREELRDLTTYLQDAREAERTRIAREIHDEFGQMLTALKMDLSWLAKRLPSDRHELEEKADAMSDVIDRSFKIVRRVSSELRPGILDDLGLAAAIEWQAELYAERSGIALRLHLDEAAEVLGRELSTALFRILQEALTNVGRHAEAEEVRIDLHVGPKDVTLVIADDGRGITSEEISGHESLGLVGMRERARALGGDVTIEGVPGEGTMVTATIPRQRQNPH